MDKPLLVLTFPKFPLRIATSKKVRRKYYRNKELSKAPKRGGPYTLGRDGYLRGKDKKKVLKNPRSAGKPSYQNLSGNAFTSGMNWRVRSTVVHELKNYALPYIDAAVKAHPCVIPIQIKVQPKVHFFRTFPKSGNEWDNSNMWFYYKYFEDAMVDYGLLIDDSVTYIEDDLGRYNHWINDNEERKIVIELFAHDPSRKALYV